jgi:hypothetical protein
MILAEEAGDGKMSTPLLCLNSSNPLLSRKLLLLPTAAKSRAFSSIAEPVSCMPRF